MAGYHGSAQRIHLALLGSDFWSRPSYPLSACHVNSFPPIMKKRKQSTFINFLVNIHRRFAVFGLFAIIICWCLASIYIAMAMVLPFLFSKSIVFFSSFRVLSSKLF